MSIHRHPLHHRPIVRGEKHSGIWFYRARCSTCGFTRVAAIWRATITSANTHSQELK